MYDLFCETFDFYRVPLWQQNRLWEFLVLQYGDTTRLYHNLDHIDEALSIAELQKDQCQYWYEVVLALIYHDFVYDTGAPKFHNETKSAEYLDALIIDLGIQDTHRRPGTHICKTATHNPMASFDAAVVIDADLYRLAVSPEKFDHFSACIREEYYWVPEDQYKIGRAAVLKGFLDKSRIFHTPYMYNRYEAKARENLTRGLEELNGSV